MNTPTPQPKREFRHVGEQAQCITPSMMGVLSDLHAGMMLGDVKTRQPYLDQIQGTHQRS